MFRQEFEVTSSGVLCPSSAAKPSSNSIAMAPLGGAERAALQGFFQTKRGTRVLIKSSVDSLVTYFADKGVTLPELNTARPAAPGQVASGGVAGGVA